MTVMTIRLPDEVKEAFDKAFEGEDKDAIIAQLIRDGLAARGIREMADARDRDLAERRRRAVDRLLELRNKMPALSNADIRKAREEGRP